MSGRDNDSVISPYFKKRRASSHLALEKKHILKFSAALAICSSLHLDTGKLFLSHTVIKLFNKHMAD